MKQNTQSIQDQRHLRNLVASSDGIAFVADGAILPRKGGADDAPMDVSQGAVPFQSPPSLRHEFTLPHHGVVSGMLLPRGVTVIVGGGYHGEETEKHCGELGYTSFFCHIGDSGDGCNCGELVWGAP